MVTINPNPIEQSSPIIGTGTYQSSTAIPTTNPLFSTAQPTVPVTGIKVSPPSTLQPNPILGGAPIRVSTPQPAVPSFTNNGNTPAIITPTATPAPQTAPASIAQTINPPTPTTNPPQGWNAQTYANFKAANPDLEPTAQDTAAMMNGGIDTSKSLSENLGYTPTSTDTGLQDTSDYYKSLVNTPVSSDQIYSDTLSKYQKAIDATNQIYSNLMTQAQKVGTGNIGAQNALLAGRGLSGSERGNTDVTNTEENNQLTYNNIAGEQADKIASIVASANALGEQELQSKRSAQQQGASAYTNFLTAQESRKQNNVNSVVGSMLSQGLDPNQIDPTQLNTLAQSLGVSPQNILDNYRQTKIGAQQSQADITAKSTVTLPFGSSALNLQDGTQAGGLSSNDNAAISQAIQEGRLTPDMLTRYGSMAVVNTLRSNPGYNFVTGEAGKDFATSTATQTFITNANTAQSTLDQIKSISNQVDRSNIKVLANGELAIKNATSDPNTAKLIQLSGILSDELGKILGSGQGSDYAIQLGKSLIDPTYSPTTFAATVDQLKGRVQNKLGEYQKTATQGNQTNQGSGDLGIVTIPGVGDVPTNF